MTDNYLLTVISRTVAVECDCISYRRGCWDEPHCINLQCTNNNSSGARKIVWPPRWQTSYECWQYLVHWYIFNHITYWNMCTSYIAYCSATDWRGRMCTSCRMLLGYWLLGQTWLWEKQDKRCCYVPHRSRPPAGHVSFVQYKDPSEDPSID